MLTVSQPREKDGKTYWQRLGVAFKTKDGRGLTVVLNALPIGENGEARLVILPQEEKPQQTRDWQAPDDDSGIPF